MDFVAVLETDPLLTTMHQLIHHPEEAEKVVKASCQRPQRHEEPTRTTLNPPVDVEETKDAYVFIADVPGLKRDDIQVQIEDDNILTLRGKRKLEEKEEDIKMLRMERRPAKFLRKFNLPTDSNMDAISASCADGVLKVSVPKLPPPEPHKPKTVQIAVS